MSLFRLPNLRNLFSPWKGLRDRRGRRADRKARQRRPRRLQLDPLEERALLSVSPADIDDTLINQVLSRLDRPQSMARPVAEAITTPTLAGDHDGNFVVVWSRNDGVFQVDAQGNPILDAQGMPVPVIDPATAEPMTDFNVYARYFTDEVQRITLPSGVLDDVAPGLATMSLTYGGAEIQKLTISATYQPFVTGQQNLNLTFFVGFDVNGDNTVGPTEMASFNFVEANPLTSNDPVSWITMRNGQGIEDVLRGLGGALADVTVQAVNAHEFLVQFGSASAGVDQPQLVIFPDQMMVSQGFLPSVVVTTVREPITVSNIPISPNNPQATAQAIQAFFSQQTYTSTGEPYGRMPYGPIEFPPPDRLTSTTIEGPRWYPASMQVASMPEIQVRPVLDVPGVVNGTVFDITYTGLSGKKDHPELKISAVQDEAGTSLMSQVDPITSVRTLKQPTGEFRVNPAEPDDPFTPWPDKFDQYNPAVAMDADGEFVIVWEGEVPNLLGTPTYQSVTDIFARRFSPVGLEDLHPDNLVQGLRFLKAQREELLRFTAANPTARLYGTFRLSMGAQVSEEILFDSDNLQDVASQIQSQLVAMGFEGLTVSVVRTNSPYEFRVVFPNRRASYNLAPIAYSTAGTSQPLAATYQAQNLNPADGYTFQVNVDPLNPQVQLNPQFQPAVGMDFDGNMVFAWASRGQDVSFFNNVWAQRFNRYGERVGQLNQWAGGPWQVSTETTTIHVEPYVAMSQQGHFLVTWAQTDDPTFPLGSFWAATVWATLYNPDGTVARGLWSPGGGAYSSAAFDGNDNYVLAWTAPGVDPDSTGQNSTGTRAVMYTLEGATIRDTFRPNSASFNPSSTTAWPLTQQNVHVGLDADGELIVVYDGYGPDVSENVWTPMDSPTPQYPRGLFVEYLKREFNRPENADLLGYFNPNVSEFPLTNFAGPGEMDVDIAIEHILFRVYHTTATAQQVGRIRALLDKVAGLLRGEANGVMYSQFDAAPPGTPGGGPLNILHSDSIVNNYRDGHNARFYLAIDFDTNGGDFDVNVARQGFGGSELRTINPVYNNGVLNVGATRDEIENELEAVVRLGNNWAEGPYEAAVEVRIVQSGGFRGSIYDPELRARLNTPWDLVGQVNYDPAADDYDYLYPSFLGSSLGFAPTDAVYEITFMGEAHDDLINFWISANRLTYPDPRRLGEVQVLTFDQDQSGWFQLLVGGQLTGPIFFDRTDLTGTAAAIQTAINNIPAPNPYAGTLVRFMDPAVKSPRAPFHFQVVFPADTGAGFIFGGPAGAPAYPGEITSIIVRNTRSPSAKYFLGQWGDQGTTQTYASMAMTPDGSFVVAWTQYDEFTTGAPSSANLHYRRFGEDRNTAGPKVTDLIAMDGSLVGHGDTLAAPSADPTVLVLTFNEELLGGTSVNSAENVQNYRLLKDGVEVPGGIYQVRFGMNMAADLAGLYSLDPTPTNKWQAVIVLDGDGSATSGIAPLGTGTYTLEAIGGTATTTGLRDTGGKGLGQDGYHPLQYTFSRQFVVSQTAPAGDNLVGPTPPSVAPPVPARLPDYENARSGRTYAENPQAVAMDADGHYVMVWTATDYTDPANPRDRVYYQLFDPNGQPAQLPMLDAGGNPVYSGGQLVTRPVPVVAVDPLPVSARVHQRHASVAMDADGDFVVTWTAFTDTDGDGIFEEEDVRARRFNALGNLKGVQQVGTRSDGSPIWLQVDDPAANAIYGAAFTVNTYTQGRQKWSNVAMDADGDFVITWSSYGQEPGQLGVSYGVFARQFNSLGEAPLPEFQVNSSTNAAANQRFSNVAISALGDFMIVWTSDQAGNDDIYYRMYAADGTPITPANVDLRVNAVIPADGHQRYPSVAMHPSGNSAVVTWSSEGQDGSDLGVYAVRLNPRTGATLNAEFLVNTTTLGNQAFPAVAMDRTGDFVITWSGRGTQPGQIDTSGFGGVYFQRFTLDIDGALLRSGTETRVNVSTTGDQWLSSVGSDADGNFVLAWTGVDPTDPTRARTAVFQYVSANTRQMTDVAPPWVSDVLTAGRRRMLQNDTLTAIPPVDKLIVLFDENMSTTNGVSGVNSILKPDNWVLARNGTIIPNGVKSVDFQWNGLTRKYEATVTFDANGLDIGQLPLPTGDYVLTVRDLVTDGQTALDGDFNGTPTTNVASGYPGYQFRFTVTSAPSDPGVLPSQAQGPVPAEDAKNGATSPETPHAVAVNDSGAYVVVWTARDDSDPNPANHRDRVYLRLFDANGLPAQLPVVNPDGSLPGGPLQTAPSPVLEVGLGVAGDQRHASVAMDADGDFVVTWTNYDALGRGDIYARRFNALGNLLGVTPLLDQSGQPVLRADGTQVWQGVADPNVDPTYGNPFLVNTYTAGDQKWSNAAMDADGDFVITWSSFGQEPGQFGAGWGVYARVFNLAPMKNQQAIAPEFLVNTTTQGDQRYSNVAISALGNFVVTWTSNLGTVAGDEVLARSFLLNGTPQTPEVQVNTTPLGNQRYPSAAMSVDGQSYVVAWASSGQDGSGDGVYARRFTWATGGALTPETPVNTTTVGDQSFPAVAIDHSGSYVVAWSGFGTQTGQKDTSGSGGVFYQRFNAAGTAQGDETRANNVTEGSQQSPSIGSDARGNFVIVWTGPSATRLGQTEVSMFVSAKLRLGPDLVGPWVTDVVLPNGTRNGEQLLQNESLPLDPPGLATLMVLFDEDVFQQTNPDGSPRANSVKNPANWVLVKNGAVVANAVQTIDFQYNALTRKYEATLTFANALRVGSYVLTARDLITDTSNNALDGDFDGTSGTSTSSSPYPGFEFRFSIGSGPVDAEVLPANPSTYVPAEVALNPALSPETPHAVASNHRGDYVVVWTAYDTVLKRDRVYFRLFDRDGTPAKMPQMDAAGTKYLYDVGGVVQAYAWGDPAIPANAVLLMAAAPVMEVNPFESDAHVPTLGDRDYANDQRFANVAMDADGDFIVTWTNYSNRTDQAKSKAPDADGDGLVDSGPYAGQPVREEQDVYARRFNAMANLKGVRQMRDSLGNPVLRSDGSPIWEGVPDAIAQETFGGAFLVNTYTPGKQKWSTVALDAAGDFVVTWSSYGQEGGQFGTTYGVYARSFNARGEAITPNEFVVNSTLAGNQRYSDVGMDSLGNFVVTWTSDQTGADAVYGRLFALSGAPAAAEFALPGGAQQRYSRVAVNPAGDIVYTWIGEQAGADLSGDAVVGAVATIGAGAQPAGSFLVNTTTLGNQTYPSVAIDRAGRFTIAWSGYGAQTGQMDTSGGVFYQRFQDAVTRIGGETRVNNAVIGNQQIPSIASDADGNLILAWTGVSRNDPAQTSVNTWATMPNQPLPNQAGPWVTGVVTVESDPLAGATVLPGDTIQSFPPGVTRLRVLFDEDLSRLGGTTGANSVFNPANWDLFVNGAKLTGAVSTVAFGWNPLTRKHEATLTFKQTLGLGNYVLVVRNTINDASGNGLDGNFNGAPAAPPDASYSINFIIGRKAADNPVLPEFPSSDVPGERSTNGRTYAETPGAVAVNSRGDYVVVWTAYDPWFERDRVYFRLFDSNGQPAALPLLDAAGNYVYVGGVLQTRPAPVMEVNPFDFDVDVPDGDPDYANDQRYPSVAMDADGDFVVTWTNFSNRTNQVKSKLDDADGDGLVDSGPYAGQPMREEQDIYARRFNALGNLKGVRQKRDLGGNLMFRSDGSEIWEGIPDPTAQAVYGDAFPVNTYTAGRQTWSNVAMDAQGDFVVTWSSYGQEAGQFGSGWGVFARVFELASLSSAERMSQIAPEFQVNTTGAGDQRYSSVAMSAQGNFAITWTANQPGTVGDDIMARTFFLSGAPASAEVVVNTANAGDQRHSDVAVSADGQSFVVVWTDLGSAADQDVWHRRFNFTGASAAAPEAQVNTTVAGDQARPSVAMDRTGAYVITWSGVGAQTGQADADGGVFYQRYDAAGNLVGGERRLNTVTKGTQATPSVASDADGNFVAAWTGVSTDLSQATAVHTYASAGVQRMPNTSGPWVSGVTRPDAANPSGAGTQVLPNQTAPAFPPGVSALKVLFDEDLSQAGASSVKGLANWTLVRNGVSVSNLIQSVAFQRNVLTRKYEATVTFSPALGLGSYVLTVRDLVTDGSNALDGDYNGTPGTLPSPGYGFPFVVASAPSDAPVGPIPGSALVPAETATDGRTYAESKHTVAAASDGRYVAVWTAYDAARQRLRLYYRLFEADGQPALLPKIDATGAKYVYLRNGIEEAYGPGESVPAGATLVRLPAPVMEVEPSGMDHQRFGTVAMDPDGDFVVTWTGYDTTVSPANPDIYARRFNAMGNLLGVRQVGQRADGSPITQGVANTSLQGVGTFRVNTWTAGNQKWSNVAMDAQGDFIITWSSKGQENNGQPGLGYGVYARRYDSFGQPLAPEFQVNVTTAGDQRFSAVDMDAVGGFVIVWTSGSIDGSDDIMARTYAPDGSPRDLGQPAQGEIRVNQTTLGNQRYPDVAMHPAGGSFTVTWTSTNQDGSGEGVYMRQFTLQVPGTTGRVIRSAVIPTLGVPIGDASSITVPGPAATSSIVETLPNRIRDIRVQVSIDHPRVSDLIVSLIDPTGREHLLSRNRPRNAAGALLPGANFAGTIFDDAATNDITDPARLPPYPDGHRPEEPLSTIIGMSMRGTWTLQVIDTVPGPTPLTIRPAITAWSLDFLPELSGPEIRVNTTTAGNQTYPSIAMDHSGGFVIAWSGQGTQLGQDDISGTGGIYYQRYDSLGTRIGGETRANTVTAGSQGNASVTVDGQGNFVLAWTGVDPTNASGTAVFTFASANSRPVTGVVGPWVAGVASYDAANPLTGGQVVLPGDVLQPAAPGVTRLKVLFDENLSKAGNSTGPASVLNPDNWRLDYEGSGTAATIQSIVFGFNPYGRRYEAILTFASALQPGAYTLTARDRITDLDGNALDGDYDGTPGTSLANTAFGGYQFPFVIAAAPVFGPEIRINDNTNYQQEFSTPYGPGLALEQSTRALAVDNDGDYVIVWTSYGQADPNNLVDPKGSVNGDIYLRLYDRNDQRLTPNEVLVNTTVKGNQRHASVAMNATGDFVVVWESEAEDPDGSWGIYARRFDSKGNPVKSDTNRDGVIDALDTNGAFRVNTLTANDQVKPAVAMDDYGNFVVVWATVGQPYSFFNSISGQLYDYSGRMVGTEFLVTQATITAQPPPGAQATAPYTTVAPTVAMSASGAFVVAWNQITQQINGVAYDTNVQARLYDRLGNPILGPFVASQGGTGFVSDSDHTNKVAPSGGSVTNHRTRNPQAVMDDDGNFIIVWEAYQDNDIQAVAGADSYGVYFRRFNADGTPNLANDHQANLVITTTTAGATSPDPAVNSDRFAGHQVNPSVAMDADGDYALVWSGPGGTPDPLNAQINPVSDVDLDGVWLRNFHAVGQTPGRTTEEYVGVQTRVNMTQTGIQRFPVIGMTRNGSKVVAWTGNGVGDRHGIFARRYIEPTDTAGPLAISLHEANTQRTMIADNDYLRTNPQQVVVVFDEAMNDAASPADARWPGSVRNPANWVLTLADGTVVQNAVSSVGFQLNPNTNKYEATVNFSTPLGNNSYTLVVRSPDAQQNIAGVQDARGNALGRTGFRPDGFGQAGPNLPNGFAFNFRVSAWTPGSTDNEFRVNQSNDPAEISPANAIPVTDQSTRAVAVNHNGDFVAVWTAWSLDDPANPNGPKSNNVFMRMFDRNNQPLMTTDFMVNTLTAGNQRQASVAMDAVGDFVVVWESDNGTGNWDVYARRFNANGTPAKSDTNYDGKIDGNDTTDQFRVNTLTVGDQLKPAVAMDYFDNFVVAWVSAAQGINLIQAQLYDYNGLKVGTEFQVNQQTFPTSPQLPPGSTNVNPTVAMNAIGNFVVAWDRVTQQSNGIDMDTVIVGRLFDRSGNPTTTETVLSVGNAAFITDAEHTPQLAATGGTATRHRARNPQAVMDAAGNFVVTWEAFQDNDLNDPAKAGPESYGIYFRRFDTTGTPVDEPTGTQVDFTNADHQANLVITTPTGLVPNPTTNSDKFALDQVNPAIAMDATGNYTIVWNGNGATPDPLNPTGRRAADPDPDGVWMRRFAVGGLPGGVGEFASAQERVNITQPNVQRTASVAMTPSGEIIVVWAGAGVRADGTLDNAGIFARRYRQTSDQVGPWATELHQADGTLVADGDNLPYNPASLVVVFDEEMLAYDTAARDSVTNPANWVLARADGSVVQGAISRVEFTQGAPSTATRKWQATVYFNAAAFPGQSTPNGGLPDGGYILIARDNLKDTRGNALTLSINTPVVTPVRYRPEGLLTPAGFADPTAVPSTAGFGFRFWVKRQPDTDTPIDPPADTEVSPPSGAGAEQSTRSVAMNHDGGFVVVWTQYDAVAGQPGVTDPNVYMQVFDRNNVALSPQTRVNTNTAGIQRHATVAMDAAGDFVVVWASQGADPDGWDIYARRFDPTGRSMKSDTNRDSRIDANDHDREFRVNTLTAGDQLKPAVAMDYYDNFVVVWVSVGQGTNQIEAQMFDYHGRLVGNQFTVNQRTLPTGTLPRGTTNVNPTVAMNADGAFIVAWDRKTMQSGTEVDSVIVGRLYDRFGAPVGDEYGTPTALAPFDAPLSVGSNAFLADAEHTPQLPAAFGTAARHRARNPQATMDAAGNFIVVWEAFQDNDLAASPVAPALPAPESYGIYFRRFDATGTPVWTDDHQANLVITTPTGLVLDQTINSDKFAGAQVNASVAVDANGNYAIVWNGNGATPDPSNPTLRPTQADEDGVWLRRFTAGNAPTEFALDLQGNLTYQQRVNVSQTGVQQFPSVAMNPDGEVVVVWSGPSQTNPNLRSIYYRRFKQSTDAAGPYSTELHADDAGRTLIADGDNLTFNPQSLVVVFDQQMMAGDPNAINSVTNPRNWVLTRADGTVIQNAVRSVTFARNTGQMRTPAGDAVLNTHKWEAVVTFDPAAFVGQATPNNGLPNGGYILIVRSNVRDVGDNPLAQTGYRPEGTAPATANPPNWGLPDPTASPNTAGFGFRFRVNARVPGTPLPGDSDQHVNTTPGLSTADQTAAPRPSGQYPMNGAVARNAAGQTVVAWVRYSIVTDASGNDVLQSDIYAQRYTPDDHPLGSEFLVNDIALDDLNIPANTATTEYLDQIEASVAIDSSGNFVVVWSGAGRALGDGSGIFGQRFDWQGRKLGGQFRINDYTAGVQSQPSVACDNSGNFFVAWASSSFPAGTQVQSDPDGVYGRFYNASGLPTTGEFRINSETRLRQEKPSVAMDADGDAVAVWASYGQDGSSWGVYGQRYGRNRAPVGTEFRVNQYTNNAQMNPQVAMDYDGDFVVVWQSFAQDGSSDGVYARRYASTGTTNEFRVNQTTSGSQSQPAVAARRTTDASKDGDFVVTWTAFNQENATTYDNAVYARMYNANTSDFQVNGQAIGEFRVNALIQGNQDRSAVAMDALGDYVVTWLGPDQLGTAVWARFLDPPGVRAVVASGAIATTQTISGTTNGDVIEIVVGPGTGNWSVKVNGVPRSVPSTVNALHINGLGGVDTVNVTLTDGNDNVDLSATGGTITGPNYTITFSNVEKFNIDGKDGANQAMLRDTAGNDTFTAAPGLATHATPALGYRKELRNFQTVLGFGGQGSDTATLTGSAGNDTFTAVTGLATMSTTAGHYFRAKDFGAVIGRAGAGGTDVATLVGDNGADYLTVSGASNTAEARTTLMAVAGGAYQRADGFFTVNVHGKGGTDIAKFGDSPLNDTFIASSTQAEIKTPVFNVVTTSFEDVTATATSGTDMAVLTDAPGTNRLDAWPAAATLTGSAGYSLTVKNFDNVLATRVYGSSNTASLNDSVGNDLFVGTPTQATLSRNGYYWIRAKAFHYVFANATAGGVDTAQLIGAGGNDALVAGSNYARLSGTGYFNRALGFAKNQVYGVKGTDTATLYDAALTQGSVLKAGTLPTTVARTLWLYDFEWFVVENSPAKGGKKVVQAAVDQVYTAYW